MGFPVSSTDAQEETEKDLDVLKTSPQVSWVFSPAHLLVDPEQEASIPRLSVQSHSSIHFQERGNRCLAKEIQGQGEAAWVEEAAIGLGIGESIKTQKANACAGKSSHSSEPKRTSKMGQKAGLRAGAGRA